MILDLQYSFYLPTIFVGTIKCCALTHQNKFLICVNKLGSTADSELTVSDLTSFAHASIVTRNYIFLLTTMYP